MLDILLFSNWVLTFRYKHFMNNARIQFCLSSRLSSFPAGISKNCLEMFSSFVFTSRHYDLSSDSSRIAICVSLGTVEQKKNIIT